MTISTNKQGQLTPFNHDFQGVFNLLSEPGGNVFSEDVWIFSATEEEKVTIDFSQLTQAQSLYVSHANCDLADLQKCTKQVWILLAEGCQLKDYKIKYRILERFWGAMSNLDIQILSKKNIADYITFLLTHTWTNGNAVRSPKLSSGANLNQMFPLDELRNAFFVVGLDVISRDLTESNYRKMLKGLISELTDDELSYADWIAGGTLDNLTLDYGKYYIEHCIDIFEKNIALVTAIESTYRSASEVAEKLGYKTSTVTDLLPKVLQGHSPEEINQSKSATELSTIKSVCEAVSETFKRHYRDALVVENIFNFEKIIALVNQCGLQASQDIIDRMQVIAWHYTIGESKRDIEKLVTEFDPYVPPQVFFDNFNKVIYDIPEEKLKVPCEDDYLAIGLKRPTSKKDAANSFPRQLPLLIRSAGVVVFVALNGWRKSEFTFPIGQVQRIRNTDKFDQFSFPYRYQVNWVIPKTHGKKKEDREITFYAYTVLKRISMSHAPEPNSPCLYKTARRTATSKDNGQQIRRALCEPWEHFVGNYRRFKELDIFEQWEKLEKKRGGLTEREKRQYAKIVAAKPIRFWREFVVDPCLRQARDRFSLELPAILFSDYGGKNRGKIDWLRKYRDGVLNPEWTSLLNRELPADTKKYIAELSDSDCTVPSVIKYVSSFVLEGKLYPNPHSFRHIWAEAVYRRFDGDVGWMIRSVFKHVSRRMWVAYVENKSNRVLHEKAKYNVISSLVQGYLNKKGVGYGGQFHRWMQRLTWLTSVRSYSESDLIAKELVENEILDITANPWGYCLLKRRTMSKAKCAVDGVPNRKNASPQLCIGCPNNLMASENLDWMLLHVQAHAVTLRHPDVPMMLRRASFDLIKKATARVKEIEEGHEALSELEALLEEFQSEEA